MSQKLRFFIVGCLVLILGIGFFISKNEARAGAAHNLLGFAWSSNVGWISFNSENCDADNSGTSDGAPAGCPPSGATIPNYGVNVDKTTGIASGYAWSSNVGWLSFNQSDLTGCPSGACI